MLKFFQSKGAASYAGCTVLEAAQALASNGVQEAQVRSIVQELVDDGHLYSTIDDDHFKATYEWIFTPGSPISFSGYPLRKRY